MKKTILYVLILMGVLSLTACLAVGFSSELVGRWQEQENPDFEVEFQCISVTLHGF